VPGNDGGVSAFRCLCGESVSRKQERDLLHALVPSVKAKRGTIQLQGPKQSLNRAHAHLGRRIGAQT
jgi:hypothetical protein